MKNNNTNQLDINLLTLSQSHKIRCNRLHNKYLVNALFSLVYTLCILLIYSNLQFIWRRDGLFVRLQSDVVHQSVFELIHTDDRGLFRRQLHFALNPNGTQQDGVAMSPSKSSWTWNLWIKTWSSIIKDLSNRLVLFLQVSRTQRRSPATWSPMTQRPSLRRTRPSWRETSAAASAACSTTRPASW